MKLNEWIFIWLDRYMKPKIKLRTYLHYEAMIKTHIVPKLGDYALNHLKMDILQSFVTYLISDGKLSDNTILGIASILKRVITDANILGFSNINEANSLSLPNPSEKEISAFTKDEQSHIVAYCLKSKPNYVGVIICLYTGIRLGELLSLTWDDIDFDKGLIKINKTVFSICKDGKYITHVDKPKTKSSNRVIPISKQLLVILKKIKKASKYQYVITTNKGNMVSNRSYQKTFKVILNKCNVNYRNFHSLRHTFATRALEMGMDVKTLSEILGHKNATITLNRYSHSLLEHKILMMNKLGKMLEV